MARVKDILAEKGPDVLSIEQTETVFDAIKAMVGANVGALLVMHEHEIVGIFTERDYLRKVAIEGRTSKTTAVSEVMSSPVIIVQPSTDIDEALALMTDRRIRHLPVVSEAKLEGVVSIGDLVKFKTKEQDFQIKYLEDYISAR